MKRSRRIGLTVMATLSLSACNAEQQAVQQALYQNQEECIDDWGSDQCEDDDRDGRWHGPRYFSHGGIYHYFPRSGGAALPVASGSRIASLPSGATPPRAVATTSATVIRGGFGRAAASHGASS